jgi:hypothetical protein
MLSSRAAAEVAVVFNDERGSVVETRLDRVDLAQLAQARPVRDFRPYKGRVHYSGWYWSSTMRGHVVYESLLELRRILLADFDTEVVGIVAQPFQLAVEVDGQVRHHVPDLLLLHRDRTITVVNVKPARRLSDPKAQSTFAWAQSAVESVGWEFEVWSGEDATRMENIRFLAGYRRPMTVRQDLAGEVIAAAAVQDLLGGIESHLSEVAPFELIRPVVLHLVWTGALTTDLSQPLGRRSPIRIGEAR